MSKLKLPRSEIAFRKEYKELMQQKFLTTVFRPGNRVFPSWRGYALGEVVTARIIEKPGNDLLHIPPTFNDVKILLRIKSLEIKSLSELMLEDFVGSSPDVQSVSDLKNHLERIYKKLPEEYDETITRIEFEYVSSPKEHDVCVLDTVESVAE